MLDSLPDTAGTLALCVLRKNAAAFAEHAPQSHPESDPEHVHQSRVAARRMRAALRVFGDILPPGLTGLDGLDGLDEELKWIAGQFGPVRDLDVQVRRLQDAAAELDVSRAIVPFGAWLEEQHQRAFTSLEDALKSQRFVALSERLEALESLAPDPGRNPLIKDDAPPRLHNAYLKLRKAARGLDAGSPPAAFHRARIRGKRFRYTVEFLEPVYGKPAQRLIKATVEMQDLLGDHQDGVVNTQRIQEAVQTVGGAWAAETPLALGRLLQWEMQRGERDRAAFGATYQGVRAAWRRLRRAL